MSKDLNNRWACLLAIVLATCSSHALGAGDYMRPANEGEPAMRGSGENRGGFFFFARACLLRCRSRLRPRSRLVPRAVLSSSRFSPRLACRSSVALVFAPSSSYRPCVSSCLPWGVAACGSCRGLVPRACGALSFSSRLPCRACLSWGGAAFVSIVWIALFIYMTCPCRGIL